MRVVYIANLGTRDLTNNGDESAAVINNRSVANCREDGQLWLRSFDAIKHQLDAPILLPGIRHVLSFTSSVDVLLFYTNQDETTEERYRRADTVNFAQVLRRLLHDRLEAGIGKVELAQIQGNPSSYDHMLPFYDKALPRLEPTEAVDSVYVAPVGGAVAANVGLTINAVQCYRDKCQCIYVTPDGVVHPLNLHRELERNYAEREAAAHLQRHDYAALRETMERSQLGRRWHQHVCDYADRRTRFDFYRAETALQAAMVASDSGEAKLQLGRLAESLRPFLIRQQSPTSDSDDAEWTSWFELQQALLGELFFNLQLKARQGAWVDFLGRLFRMREALLRLAFETAFRHSTEKRGQQFGDFVKAIEADKGLLEFMKSKLTKSADGKSEDEAKSKDDAKREPLYAVADNHTLSLALEYLVTRAGRGAQFGPISKLSNKVTTDQLVQLRNKSIVAHGYEGVSREDVERAAGIPTSEMIERLSGTLEKLGVDVGNQADPYVAAEALLGAALT